MTNEDEEAIHLETFLYEQGGSASQIFELPVTISEGNRAALVNFATCSYINYNR